MSLIIPTCGDCKAKYMNKDFVPVPVEKRDPDLDAIDYYLPSPCNQCSSAKLRKDADGVLVIEDEKLV